MAMRSAKSSLLRGIILFSAILFACESKRTDAELKSCICEGPGTYWDIAGGKYLQRITGSPEERKAYQNRTGNYFDCHYFNSKGQMVHMGYSYLNGQVFRGPIWNGDVSNATEWEVVNGRLRLWSDTLTIEKCTEDSLIVRSRTNSIV